MNQGIDSTKMPKKLIIIAFVVLICMPLSAQSGTRYELNSITFTGNNSFSSSVLSDVIYSKVTPWWFWKFLHSFSSLGKEPSYFDSTNISLDLTALKDYYTSNGFFDARFSYKYKVNKSDKDVDLTYIIKENSPSDFGKLNVYGLRNIPEFVAKNLYNDLEFDTTKRYSQSVVQSNTNSVINGLLNNGYMLAKFDSTIVIKDTMKNQADINIYFSTGKRYQMDTVLVRKQGKGADLVSDELLTRITGIKYGTFYRLDELRRSQVRLYRTGLFDAVTLSAKEKDTTDSKVPIQLQGTIGLMNELSPEIILNNQQSAFNVGLGMAYIRKNFLGDARKLTFSSSFAVQDIINADLGNLIRRFSFRDTTLLGYVDSRITVEQPYLFNRPIFGTWETYAKIDKQSTYNNTVYGSKVTFEFELPEYTFINHLSTSYTVEQSNEVYRTYHDSIAVKEISDIAADAASTTADNILFPTKGYNLSFHVEEANSLPYFIAHLLSYRFNTSKMAMFYKLQLNGSYYISLDRKRNSIAAFRFMVGNIHVLYGNFFGVPINRTFYAGGSNSIRGWRSNQLVPKGSRLIQGLQGVSVQGGSFLMEGSMEWRYKFLENVGLALFSDYGNTWLGYDQVRWNDIAVAVGFGIRYYTQIAPFRIDFGFKFYNPDNNEFLWQSWNQHVFDNISIHFGIGEAF